MTSKSSNNLALLIDADNVSAKVITGLMTEISKYGTASVRRIYGDFTTTRLARWKHCLLQHSIIPMQQFEYTTGKNSTDSAMIIDAMDLLYTGRFSGFCIVSSDSDFTRLAARIREQGLKVYGFGEKKTNTAFIAACSTFVYFHDLDAPTDETTAPMKIYETFPPPHNASLTIPSHPPRVPRVEQRKMPPNSINHLRAAINESLCVQSKYAKLVDVRKYLERTSPCLVQCSYHYESWREFVESSGIVHVKVTKTIGRPPVSYVCLKENMK